MVDLVFRLFRRRPGVLVVIRALRVKVGEHCSDSSLLWVVACHMALLLTQQVLAIHLQLYLLALGGRESAVKCRRLGYDRATAARRAVTRSAWQFTGQ
jgi:hypothetical protein